MPSDRALWAAVVEQRGRALRVARSRCATPQDAEDCVQEAMLRVAGMDDVDLERVGPLLSTVVRHLAVDTHRSRVRGARAQGRLHALPQPQAAVDERVLDVDEARWLWGRRHELREQDRRVFELRAQGLTVAQAASALGITPKAAESSFTRARSRLRGIWKAAGAALAVLWAGTRRPGPALAGASVAVASVVAVTALAAGGDAPGRAPAGSPASPSAPAAEPVTQSPATLLPVPDGAPTSPVGTAPAASPKPTRPAAPAAVPEQGGDRRRASAAQPATQSPQSPSAPETLPQAVERCVRDLVGGAAPQDAPTDCSPR